MESLKKIIKAQDYKALEAFVDELILAEATKKQEAKDGRMYYENKNAIRQRSGMDTLMTNVARDKSPLRNADFRISHNWHQLLVNQKVSYLFSASPTFDCGSTAYNKKVNDVLGGDFSRTVKNLGVDAANCGVGWLHLWLDANGKLCYATVPMEEIYPIYTEDLSADIDTVIRIYSFKDEGGEVFERIEVWDEAEVAFFMRKKKGKLSPELRFDNKKYQLPHGLGMVPFVAFYNNSTKTGDLSMVKDLIDQYDLVVSGFANDLSDIQEVIFVLRNYGGEDLNTFLSELKRYKTIKVEGDAVGAGGVETMKIEIPVEARVKFLELLKKQIFISGQGVNPDPENFGNSSGVALKYLYSLLEIKAGLLETEFRSGFYRLFQMLLLYLGLPQGTVVTQIFNRNAIENDLELVEIAEKSQGIISEKTVLLNHPWVEHGEEEIALRKAEKEKSLGD